MDVKRYDLGQGPGWEGGTTMSAEPCGDYVLYADHFAAVREAVKEEREEVIQDVLAEAMDCGCVDRIVARLNARWAEEANHDPH